MIRHRRLIVVLGALFAIVSGGGMSRLRFCHDMDAMFDDDNPQLKALIEYRDTFGDRDNVLFTLAPRYGDVFSFTSLTLLQELSDAVDELPYMSHVYSLARFRGIHFDGEDILIENLYDSVDDLTDSDLAALREKVLDEPLLVHQLVSADGSAAVVFARLELPEDDLASASVAAAAQAVLDKFRLRYPEIDLHLTGSVMMSEAFRTTALQGFGSLVPLMFLVIFMIIGVALRSFSGVLAVMVVMSASVVSACGLTGWLGIPLTIVSAIFPGLVITLAVADCVHIVNSTFQRMRAGASQNAAIVYAVRMNLKPVLLTSFTTAIGFLSLNFSESPPFRDLGNLIAIGVMNACLFSVMLLPSLLAILPLRARKADSDRMTRLMRALSSWVGCHYVYIRFSCLAIVAVLVLGVFRLELDTNVNELYSRKLEVRRATDFHIERMGVSAVIGYPLDSGVAHGVTEPEYLNIMDRFARWYRDQPEVLHVSSLADIIKRMNRAMHDDDPDAERIPDCRSTNAQYLLFYGMSLPSGHGMAAEVDITERIAAMHVMTQPMSSSRIRALDNEAQAWLRDHAPETMQTAGSAPGRIWAHLTYRNFRTMMLGTLIAMLLISLLIAPALQSVRFGLLSLPPNLLPPLVMFGLWGYTVGRVGLPASMISAIMLGIVVDDTIHFLCRYTRARRIRGMGSERALQYTFETVVPALCITTLALVTGFLTLTLSPFGMISSIGSMSTTVIALALLLDLFLLPSLILTVERRDPKRMRKSALLLLILCALPISVGANEISAEERGRLITEEVHYRVRGFGTSAAQLQMTLENRRGHTSVRQMRFKLLEREGGGFFGLCIVDAPPDVRGTALLTHNHSDGNMDQWIYMPALRRTRRIASRGRSGSFMGSEFTYEDLSGGLGLEHASARWLRDEEYNGSLCHVIEYISTDLSLTDYARRVVWIDRDDFRIYRVDYYSRRNEFLKSLAMTDHQLYRERFWHATTMTMVNQITGNQSQLEWRDIHFGVELNPHDFDRHQLQHVR